MRSIAIMNQKGSRNGTQLVFGSACPFGRLRPAFAAQRVQQPQPLRLLVLPLFIAVGPRTWDAASSWYVSRSPEISQTRSIALNPAWRKWTSAVSASANPSCSIKAKEMQSVRLHSLSGRAR